jgi:phosphate transport system substrate-binding protein
MSYTGGWRGSVVSYNNQPGILNMNNPLRRSLFYSTAMIAFAAVGSHGAMAQSGASVLGGGSTLAYPTVNNLEFNTATAGGDFTYCSVGSGAGTSAFVSNTDVPLAADAVNCKGVTGQAVDYGASDAFISPGNVTTFGANAHAGPLIQVPIFGTPVTFPFKLAGHTTNGSQTLTEAQLCGIFSGQITDWHTIDSTVASGTTIKVGYRLDSSGTSFLLTNNLKTICPIVNSTAFTTTQLGTMPTTTFAASLFPGGVPSNFTGGTGSTGVQTFVKNTANSVAYLSPDYTAISVTGNTAGAPVVAAVTNRRDGTPYTPTVAHTSTALGTITAPTGAAEKTQSNWAPQIPDPAHGYPVAGYTYWFLATCYNKTTSAGVASDLISFLQEHYNISNTAGGHTLVTDITNGGFVPVTGSSATAPATGFAAAINTVFLLGDTQKLNVANTGTGSANSTCVTLAGR